MNPGKYSKSLAVIVLWTAAASVVVAEEHAMGPLLEECLPAMGAERIPDRQESQQRLQDACFALGTPGREAARAEACTVIVGKLGPGTAKPARLWLLKQLEFIGRGECVDAVAKLMQESDPEIRDAARRALQNNPAAEANTRLLDARRAANETPAKIALVGSLGFRGDPASVDLLAAQISGSDRRVAATAACALGKIGNARAADALAKARLAASADLRGPISDAWLRCADQMLAEGNPSGAAAIYEQLAAAEEARAIRLAALRGQLRSAGSSVAELVLRMLNSGDADVREIAAGYLGELRGEVAMKEFAAAFSKLPLEGKVLLLSGLAARGDKSAGPVALEAAGSDEPEVRLAGILALAKLGDAAAVPLLVSAVTAGDERSGPARESLQAVFGTGVDEAIVEAMKAADVGPRATLIDVIDARRAAVAVPALLEQASGKDAGIRSRAIRTLGNVGQPEHIPAVVALLLKSEKGRERDDWEKAVMLLSGRVSDSQPEAAPALEILAGCSDAEKCILLPAIGRIGGKEALAAVEGALNSDDAEIRDAAVRALCNWPDGAVADALMRIVDTSDNQEHRIWALRAYVRVISLPSDEPAAETLKKFQQAMEKAWRLDEKKLVLSRVSAARCLETLRWVAPYLEQSDVSREASLAIVELAHRRELMTPNFEEFSAALEKVAQTCKDRGIADRAKRYMQGL